MGTILLKQKRLRVRVGIRHCALVIWFGSCVGDMDIGYDFNNDDAPNVGDCHDCFHIACHTSVMHDYYRSSFLYHRHLG